MHTLTKLLVVALVAPHCLAQVELTGTPEDLEEHLAKAAPRVVLTAKAELEAEADQALVKLQVLTNNKKLRKALAENQQMRAELTKHLDAHGIPKDRIKSSRYSSTPQPGLFRKTGSYDVQNTVTVTIDSESQFQIVADFVDDNKEVTYMGVTFKHSNARQKKLDVIGSACERLGEKRAAYEKALGVKLELVSFAERPAARTQMQMHDQFQTAFVSSLEPIPGSASIEAEVEAPSRFSDLTFLARIAGEFRVVTE